MRKLTLVLLVLSSPLLFAAKPEITSVFPSSGPLSGGTAVTIRGSGFSNVCAFCSPPFGTPQVYFGSVPAESVDFVDPSTLIAVTPASLPLTVNVMVMNLDGSDPDILENGFTYTGDVYDEFEPILFPVFTPPVAGQFGSEYQTTAKFWNRSYDEPVTFYGLDTSCTLIDPPLYPELPFILAPRQPFALDLFPGCNYEGGFGKLFYVPKGDDNIAASLRVWETSRQAENHGVEIPVARLEDFDDDSIALVDVPTDPKFRLTLRIYGLNRGESLVNLWFGNESGTSGPFNSVQVPLIPGRNMFEPSYAVFTDFRPAEGFPPFGETINVLVDVPQAPEGAPSTPIWAFITVTNNETQHITAITPQQ